MLRGTTLTHVKSVVRLLTQSHGMSADRVRNIYHLSVLARINYSSPVERHESSNARQQAYIAARKHDYQEKERDGMTYVYGI